MRRSLILLLLCALFLTPLAPAAFTQSTSRKASGTISGLVQTVTLTATKDNTLYEDPSGALSNGSGNHLFVGRTASGGGALIRRGLVQFDLSPIIPPASTIVSATLTMTMSKTISGPTDVSLHRVTTDWGAGASDAPGAEGAGTAAQPGDATWLHAFFDAALWSTAGGDFIGMVSGTTAVGSEGVYTWRDERMEEDLQRWSFDPASNYGWILIGDESAATTAKRFDASNMSSASGPQLVVQFIPAEQVYLPLIQQ